MLYYKDDPELFENKASVLKALSHPIRLCIVKNLIAAKKANVTQMQHCLEAPQSTISQHLSKLKAEKIIKGERKGLEVYYSISNEKIIKIIEVLFCK
ncbi:ArsR/SmtB family transcription factor [Psychrilyobacter atlanticus]|uniref:ArsR/SmtB family transcription factor n=1 Tax=Psychrilyobacter atlanticus TaxID=271091 RepID=UPI000403D61C|nr:metalloregulator ArsR/SmtB family transcription factor [Psychrilyobacter atlanticus]